jgi:DNA repair exonuclease SbcCD ATPase subunit
MARQKRTSPIAEAAQTRADSLESINAALDLGNGLTLENFQTEIDAVEEKLSDYNTKLSELDGMLTALENAETALADKSERMLTGVASKYGKDSAEYEKAGGTKKSDIKRGPKKKKPPTA